MPKRASPERVEGSGWVDLGRAVEGVDTQQSAPNPPFPGHHTLPVRGGSSSHVRHVLFSCRASETLTEGRRWLQRRGRSGNVMPVTFGDGVG